MRLFKVRIYSYGYTHKDIEVMADDIDHAVEQVDCDPISFAGGSDGWSEWTEEDEYIVEPTPVEEDRE